MEPDLTGVNCAILNDPCVVFALPWEARAFLRRFAHCQRLATAPCPTYRCRLGLRTILVAQIGVGIRCMPMLEWLVGCHVPYLVSAGFSGALRSNCHVGEVIVATEIVDTEGHVWPTTWPASGLPPGFRQDRLLSVNSVVGTPALKMKLGQDFQAGAVDMETAIVARHCTAAGVPFGCIRVISDTMQTSLSPRLVSLIEAGGISTSKVAWNVLHSPKLIPELWRLARDTHAAARCLADALVHLLGLTG